MFILFYVDWQPLFCFGFLSYRHRIGSIIRSFIGFDIRDNFSLKRKETKTVFIDIFWRKFEFEIGKEKEYE